MNGVEDLDDDTWRERLETHRGAVIEFWAPWCASCLAQRRVIDALAEVVGDHVALFRADVATTRIDRALGVVTVPTVLALRSGVEVARISGDATRVQLLETIAQALDPAEEPHATS